MNVRWGSRRVVRAATATVAALTAAIAAFWVTGGDLPGRAGDAEGRQTLRALAAASPAPSSASSGQTRAVGSAAADTSSALPRITTRDAGLSAVSRSAPDRSRTPLRLVIPALGAELPISPTGLDEKGFMDLPDSPKVAGWYRFSPTPGSGGGATVLAAHVDTRREGPGPLARLQRLGKGDIVEVSTATQTHLYQVASVARLGKREVDLEDLFSRTGAERVHVITCGGSFDSEARRYEDNVIAVAVKIGTK